MRHQIRAGGAARRAVHPAAPPPMAPRVPSAVTVRAAPRPLHHRCLTASGRRAIAAPGRAVSSAAPCRPGCRRMPPDPPRPPPGPPIPPSTLGPAETIEPVCGVRWCRRVGGRPGESGEQRRERDHGTPIRPRVSCRNQHGHRSDNADDKNRPPQPRHERRRCVRADTHAIATVAASDTAENDTNPQRVAATPQRHGSDRRPARQSPGPAPRCSTRGRFPP